MKLLRMRNVLAVVVPLVVTGFGQAADKPTTADKLVLAAMRAEVDGSADPRQLLVAALEKSPAHAFARWHSGYIREGRRWTHVDDLIESRREQIQLTAYQVQRDRLLADDSLQPAERHRQMAAWCAEHQLRKQQRAHLTGILDSEPDNIEARRQLGHVMVSGVWLDSQELQTSRQRALRAAQAMAVWRPRLIDLVRRLGGGEGSSRKRELTRQTAISDWQALNDPAAIPAMEVVFSTRSSGPVMLIEKLGTMTSHEAAVSLARHAVFSIDPAVRQYATEKLKSRPYEHFVPVMLAAMRTPLQTRAELYQTPDGRLLYRQMYYREGQENRELAVLDTVFGYEATATGSRQRAFGQVIAQVRSAESSRRGAGSQGASFTEALNERVCEVLAAATGEQIDSSPENWWQWWNDYNEMFVAGQKPVLQTYRQRDIRLQGQRPRPPSGSRTGSSPQAAAIAASLRDALRGIRGIECLAAGTQVWTDRGPRPIEQIQIGDLVLSQHPETGELACKPVLRTTTREARPVVRIALAEETISASGGHLFWLAGEGWVRARELTSTQRFHSLTDTTTINATGVGESQPTYNLIVADFHTYFVGAAKILSHDNTMAQPTDAVIPGYGER